MEARLNPSCYSCWSLLLVLALPLGFSEKLNLVHLSFPDHSISLWGAESAGDPVVF